MTGGTERAREINRRLARAAQAHGIAMGVGSQRAAIQHPELADTFRVRDVAPGYFALGQPRRGAAQLWLRRGALPRSRRDDRRRRAHPAPQPAARSRPAGRRLEFFRPAEKDRGVCRTLGVPVIAKEVGWGISEQAARQLAEAGVAAIDVAGGGGTSWSEVEKHRATNACAAARRRALPRLGHPHRRKHPDGEARRAAPAHHRQRRICATALTSPSASRSAQQSAASRARSSKPPPSAPRQSTRRCRKPSPNCASPCSPPAREPSKRCTTRR